MIVTVSVAMIVLAVGAPSFLSWMPTIRLSSAARQVATDLQVARMKAISQNTSYTVTFNASAGTYAFGSDSRDIGQLYPGITIVSVSANPVFSPRGTATASSTITLNNGSLQTFICVKNVGRVNIQNSTCA